MSKHSPDFGLKNKNRRTDIIKLNGKIEWVLNNKEYVPLKSLLEQINLLSSN